MPVYMNRHISRFRQLFGNTHIQTPACIHSGTHKQGNWHKQSSALSLATANEHKFNIAY